MLSNREQDDLMQTYAAMSDLELRELHAAEDQLTEIARSVLHDEIRKRQLDLTAPPPPPPTAEAPDDATEYTWKVDLITLRDSGQAGRVMLALKQSGIESFIRSSRDSYGGYAPSGPTTVQVPADQLEAAQTILAHLTPEKLSALEPEESEPAGFETPACPKCHAEEAMLLDTEPVNRWQCDDCGFEWSDPTESA
jgi:hypothetical protein